MTPATIVLNVGAGASLSLTASNGPVNWSISPSSALAGGLTISPSSGTLAAGQSVTVTITVRGLVSLSTRLTVSPGGQQITVMFGLG